METKTQIANEKASKQIGRRIVNIQGLLNYFENSLFPLIQKKDKYREKTREILDNKEKLKSYDKRWLALEIVYENYRELKNDSRLFINRLLSRINEIESYDRGLAEHIRNINVDNKEIKVLNELATRLESIPEEQAIYFMRKYYKYYLREFNKFKDEKIVDELKRTLFLITGEEIYYLNRYLKEVRQWPLLARTKGIDYFTKRLNTYIKNNFEGYKGLVSDFKDKEIAKMILKSKEVRRLFNYQEEEKFFDNVMNYIIKVRRNPNWIADFVDIDSKTIRMSYYEKRGFHDNLKKHRNFIKLVKEKFGNKEFAEFLEYLEKKYKEQPSQEVENRIIELDRLLKSGQYQIRNVVLPAEEKLTAIFTKRIQDLEKEREKGLSGLKKFLRVRINEIESLPKKSAKRLMRQVWKEELKIKRHWMSIKKEFDKREIKILRKLAEFATSAYAIEKYDSASQLDNIKKINQIKSSWIKYSHGIARRLKDLRIAAKVIPMLKIATTTLEESIERIDEQSEIIEESVLYKLPEKMKQLIETNRKLSRIQDELILYLIQIGIISRKDLAKDNLVLVRGETKEQFAVMDISMFDKYRIERSDLNEWR